MSSKELINQTLYEIQTNSPIKWSLLANAGALVSSISGQTMLVILSFLFTSLIPALIAIYRFQNEKKHTQVSQQLELEKQVMEKEKISLELEMKRIELEKIKNG
jgi:lipoprotein signal peptidase